MTIAWAVNTLGHFFVAVGGLLIFLYLWRSPRFAESWLSPEGQRAYAKHRLLLTVGVGFVAAWLVVQYLALILI
jgi:hypothetical protein